MELRVEALPGYSLPNGCFVGVRVGEVLKQGRYDPTCCYRFPALERQRNAKIDLYQHLGTCSAIVDPESRANNEVKVAGADPGFGELRLKVMTRPEASKPEERKTEVKKQAKDYLGRHRVEERLCNAVKALLAAQPEDPTEFLVAHLRESCPKAVATKATYATPFPAPMQPFERYYRTHVLRETPLPVLQKTYSKFPPAAPRLQPTPAATPAPAVSPAPVAQVVDIPDDAETNAAATKLQSIQRGKQARKEVASAAPTKPQATPDRTMVLDEKTQSFQAYHNKYIAPQTAQSFWNSVYSMFPASKRHPPT